MHRNDGGIDTSFKISTSSYSRYLNGLEHDKQRILHQTISSQIDSIDNNNSVEDNGCDVNDVYEYNIIPSNNHLFMYPGMDTAQLHENKNYQNVMSVHKSIKMKRNHNITPINIDKKKPMKPRRSLSSPLHANIHANKQENGARVSATMSLSTGQLAHMWKLKEKLGDGAFGSVWHAISRIDSQSYAIKMIPFYHKSELEENSDDCPDSEPISSVFDPYNEESFREVRTMAKMDGHPCVVRYYTAWIEEIQPFIYEKIKDIDAMQPEIVQPEIERIDTMIMPDDIPHILDNDEYDIKDDSISSTLKTVTKKKANRVLIIQMEMCDNGTLKDWLKSRKEIDYIQSLQIFRQLVQGLHHIHQNRVLHRDVKPGNIFLCKKGGIKLGDFGLSSSANDRIRRAVAASINNAVTFEDDNELTLGLGTPTYAAPEQLNHSQILQASYSKPADIYPLGLIAYELLNKWSTGMERVIAINELKTKYTINDIAFKERWPRLSYLIEAMISLQPENRPTCEDILEVLDIEWNELQIDCCAHTICQQHSISMGGSISMSMSPRCIQPQSINESKFRRSSIHLLLSPTVETSARTSFAPSSELCIDNDTDTSSEKLSPEKFKKMEQKLISKDEEIQKLKKRIDKLEKLVNDQYGETTIN